jgi:hypothetical protein
MRVRQAVSDRPVNDVDLVWRAQTFPDVRRLLPGVMSRPFKDGARFDAERFRVDAIHFGGRLLGVRIVAAGQVDGRTADFTVDVHRRIELGLEPVRRAVKAERGQGHLWMCEPETLIGRKVRVIALRGRERWRPKDLADIYALLVRGASGCSACRGVGADRLAAGLEAAFSGDEDARDAARATFAFPGWWAEPSVQIIRYCALARYQRMRREAAGTFDGCQRRGDPRLRDRRRDGKNPAAIDTGGGTHVVAGVDFAVVGKDLDHSGDRAAAFDARGQRLAYLG